MHIPNPRTRKLMRCPHCSGLHQPEKAGIAVPREPVIPFPDFLAELRRNFRYDASAEQPFTGTAGS